MKRPWYRSRLFWLGVPGLVFLLWAWFGLARRDVFVEWGQGGWSEGEHRWGIGTCDGSLSVYKHSNTRVSISSDFESGLSYGMEEVFEEPEVPEYFTKWGSFYDFGDGSDWFTGWQTNVAWWLVLLAYLTIWVGAYFGWKSWKQKSLRD